MGCYPPSDDHNPNGPGAARVQQVTLSHAGGQRLQLEATFSGEVPPTPRVVQDRFGLIDAPGSIYTDYLIRPSHDDRVIAVSSPMPSVRQDWRADISEFDKSNPDGVLVSASARGKILTLVLDLAGQRELLSRGPFKADVSVVQMVVGQPTSTGAPNMFPVRSPDCHWDTPAPTADRRQPLPAQPPTWPEAPPSLPETPGPESTPAIPVSGVDTQGFLEYPPARCDPGDKAAMVMRTEASLVVICYGPRESLYYKGMRLSDSAAIRLDNVTSNDNGFTAINPTDGTQYEATLRGLTIVVGGQVVASEAAAESAFL